MLTLTWKLHKRATTQRNTALPPPPRVPQSASLYPLSVAPIWSRLCTHLQSQSRGCSDISMILSKCLKRSLCVSTSPVRSGWYARIRTTKGRTGSQMGIAKGVSGTLGSKESSDVIPGLGYEGAIMDLSGQTYL